MFISALFYHSHSKTGLGNQMVKADIWWGKNCFKLKLAFLEKYSGEKETELQFYTLCRLPYNGYEL